MLKIEQNKNQVKLSGELNFDTVAKALKQSVIDFSKANNKLLDIDLSQVTRFNSASLALLIEWMNLSQQHAVQITYHGVPEQLKKIAQAYACDQMLHLA